MGNAAILCRGVSKHFGSVRAVDGVSFNLVKGRTLALLGPSGCGKTTTLRLLAGFEVPEGGVIEIGGHVVVDDGRFVPPEQRKVGMVFQDYALFPHLDVAANVAFGLPKASGRASHVQAMLTMVGLEGLDRRMPHELSGGQQQRVALARALAPGPEVVLLDEPFSNLDAGLRAKVRAEVREILHAAGAAAVFVTHDQQEALSLADIVAVMLEGRIVQLAEPEQIYHRPATKEIACFVGDADFVPGEATGDRIVCELGTVQGAGRLTGPVEVLLRPENVELLRDDTSPHEVASRDFFGHDQIVTVRLASGKAIRSRLGFGARFSPGDRVQVRLRSEVLGFSQQPFSLSKSVS